MDFENFIKNSIYVAKYVVGKISEEAPKMAEQIQVRHDKLVSQRESEVRRLELKGENRTLEEDERLMNLYAWLSENGNG